MFYCEPCRVERAWPESLSKSFGLCELCSQERICNDRPSSTLPLPPAFPRKHRGEVPPDHRLKSAMRKEPLEKGSKVTIKHQRVADFMGLFTQDEIDSWKGKDNKAPEWVLEAICWFMDQEPEHRDLMRRLLESGD